MPLHWTKDITARIRPKTRLSVVPQPVTIIASRERAAIANDLALIRTPTVHGPYKGNAMTLEAAQDHFLLAFAMYTMGDIDQTQFLSACKRTVGDV